VVDNCNDSTRDNYCVVAGIEGDEAAETEYWMQSSVIGTTNKLVSASNMIIDYNEFVVLTDYLWAELQGTVDATASGGEYQQSVVSTSDQYEYIFTIADFYTEQLMLGREIYCLFRAKDDTAGANYTFKQKATMAGTMSESEEVT